VTAADEALRKILKTLGELEESHRTILTAVQRSRARASTVEATIAEIDQLGGQQSVLLREAAVAIRAGLYRSGIVSSYAALADALHEHVDKDGGLASLAASTGWTLSTRDDLQDHPDHDVATAARRIGLVTKPQMKSFHGLLHRRNQAAHPTPYQPNLDEALGFVSESIGLIRAWKP